MKKLYNSPKMELAVMTEDVVLASGAGVEWGW